MANLPSLPPEEQDLVQRLNFIYKEPCEKCGCRMYRTFFDVVGCVRCYPKNIEQYWVTISKLYPDRRFEQRF